VAAETFEGIRGYTSYNNVGTANRGTAFLVRENIRITKLTKLPSGRGIAAEVNGLWIVHIYAPSGAERRRERENFFAVEMPTLLQNIPANMIIGGDFNCALAQTDATVKA